MHVQLILEKLRPLSFCQYQKGKTFPAFHEKSVCTRKMLVKLLKTVDQTLKNELWSF